MSPQPNFYSLLGLAKDATTAEIEAACLKLGEQYRPDKNAGESTALAIFQLVEEAHATLLDPRKRAAYDAQLLVENGALAISDASLRRDSLKPGKSKSFTKLERRRAAILFSVIGAIVLGSVLVPKYLERQEQEQLTKARTEAFQEARAAFIALSTLQSRTEVGITYLEYGRLVGESKAQVDLYVAQSRDKSDMTRLVIRGHLLEIIRFHVFALETWRIKIESRSDELRPYDDSTRRLRVALREAYPEDKEMASIVSNAYASIPAQPLLQLLWGRATAEVTLLREYMR